ncbi:MAG: response regulator [Candidatus Saelkia tenebricola]|nr:response regulator [Candidatus Saelkia tenebricola]
MKKILIVDDEPDLRTVAKMRLEVEGYQIIVGSNGQECLDLAQKEMPDLIILDIMMPVMDGYTALKHLKADQSLSEIPVIMFSIKEKMKMEGLFITDMVECYIEKPFEAEELVSKVKSVLGE